MKEIVTSLIKKYYELSPVIKQVIIVGKGEHTQVVSNNVLAAVAWQLKDDENKPDITKQDEIIEITKEGLAQNILGIAINMLKSQMPKNKNNDYRTRYDEFINETNSNINPKKQDCDEKVSWALAAFFWLHVIEPWEYDISETIFDESGIFLGPKKLPKGGSDEVT